MIENLSQVRAQVGPIPRNWLIGLVAVLVLAGASYITYTILNRDMAIMVDGKNLQVHTFAKSVGAVLDEEQIRVRPEDVVEPGLTSPTRDGLVVDITRAFPVTLVVGGEELKVLTVSCSVQDLIAKNDITVRDQDKVFPALDTKVKPDSTVRILRLDEKVVTEKAPIPFVQKRTRDERMDMGKIRVISPGSQGILEKTIRIRMVDGKEAGRDVLSRKVIASATTRVVAFGVRPPLRTLFTSRGRYTYRKMQHMMATAYVGGGRRTAGRYRSGPGIVAVDPRVIPMHTELYIEGYGKAIAGDTGGAIKGNRVDLGYTSYRSAMQFGRRRVRVYILEK